MAFTDFFIKKPVLSIAIGVFILAIGLRALISLPVMQYPASKHAVITVSTPYVGASPELIAGFITTPIETAVSQAGGIDYITSTSTLGMSKVSAYLQTNYDPFKALSEITTSVNSAINQLPAASQQPQITVSVSETVSSMYIAFSSDSLSINQITDYLIRIVQPQLQGVSGVQSAKIQGGKKYALRAWLDETKLAGYGLSATEVNAALLNNNMLSSLGRTDGKTVVQNLTAKTNIDTVNQFNNLIIKAQNGAAIHLKDVAHVELGSQTYESSSGLDGHQEAFVTITVTPSADVLSVLKGIKKILPQIQAQLPQGMKATLAYDASIYIQTAINNVIKALFYALFIVAGVILIFLNSFRTAIIPMISIPLSIIGTFAIMMMLGYSINLLTLLALVLAIGLVVDDTIIIVENIKRYMEMGKSAFEASLIGARELVHPIIAITIVLISVYLPIGYMGGITGALFREFAYTLASAVTISAIIALSLSPVMCAAFLKHSENTIHYGIDHFFNKLGRRYAKLLIHSFHYLPVTILFSAIIIASTYFLFITSQSDLAPQEDQGILIVSLQSPSNASLKQTLLYSSQAYNKIKIYPEIEHVFQIDNINNSFLGVVLKPWDQRKRSANQLQHLIQENMNSIAGAEIAVFQPPSLPGGGSGAPIQLAITTTNTFEKLNQTTQQLIEKAHESHLFAYLDSDLKFNQQQTELVFDREKIAQLGLTMQNIASSLSGSFSQNYVNYFNYAGRSYEVIPQMRGEDRLNPEQLLNYYLTLPQGGSVPLSTIAMLKEQIVPQSLKHFQLRNSATLSAVPFPGVSMSEALATFSHLASSLPQGYEVDYEAQSRQFMNERASIVMAFFFALIVIFLVLSVLFESFRDPLIILVSVPMSICGAMIFISMGIGGLTLNIYSEIGLVTLIGLVSKQGIVLLQFANDLQQNGKTKLQAMEIAARIRLRPILMTSLAMITGVIPLIFASGAGAVSRYNIGMITATGISIGTMFILFVLPAMYILISKEINSPRKRKSLQLN